MYHRTTPNRLFYTLFIAQSLFSAAQIAVFTLIAIVAVRLSGTESTAGLPASTLTFTQALSAFPIAIIMGRFGRRLGLSVGYGVGILAGIVGVIAVLQGIFPLLLLSAALSGIARASSEQGRFAVGELFPEAERARMIGRLVFAGTVGAVAGPVLVAPTGRLMESLGLSADIGPWVALAVLCGLSALLIFALLRPDPMIIARTMFAAEQKNTSDEPEQPVRAVRGLPTLLMLPKVKLAILAVLISQTVMVVLMVMTPLHMDHQHHGRDAISFVISMHTLGMFGLSPLTGYLIDRFGRISTLLAGALILMASALLAPLAADEYVLALALFLLGLGWNFGYVAGSSLLSDALQGEERTRVQGINDALVFFVAGMGSLGAGPLFASGGYGAISIAGLILVLALIGLILWFNRPQFEVGTVSSRQL